MKKYDITWCRFLSDRFSHSYNIRPSDERQLWKLCYEQQIHTLKSFVHMKTIKISLILFSSFVCHISTVVTDTDLVSRYHGIKGTLEVTPWS